MSELAVLVEETRSASSTTLLIHNPDNTVNLILGCNNHIGSIHHLQQNVPFTKSKWGMRGEEKLFRRRGGYTSWERGVKELTLLPALYCAMVCC